MKRILVVVLAGLLLALVLPRGALAFGMKDVMAMSREGIPDSLIIEKIRHSGTSFDLDAKDFHALREAGVSDEVVVTMLRTEDRDQAWGYPYGYGYWGGPYYRPWAWDLDIGFYVPYHRTVYVGPGFGSRGFGRGGHGFRRR